jgi:class 3 adenylate cyclase/tetratricopeptide (TPR) repeat protein
LSSILILVLTVLPVMICPRCQHQLPAEARFCDACGAGLAQTCTACGAPVRVHARFCSACGVPVRPPPPHLCAVPAEDSEGERRQLTVAFCDLVDSTALSQRLDAEEWRDVIAQYQRAAAAAAARFGGHVAKNLGDGLLIYFGWPSAREDDPERALRAGLAIVEAVRALGGNGLGELGRDLANPLSVRVGIHTGQVVIADGGEVFGETANIAARVQSVAEPATVVITGATQRLVAGIFVVDPLGAQALKGIREPVPLYRLGQPSGVRSRLAVAAGRLTPFAGRQIELATLVERWERAQDGEGQSVLVQGEAGVGKSRLVYQLREQLAGVPHTWLECSATPYTVDTPFHPIITLVADGLAFAPADSISEKLAKLERGLGALATPEAIALLATFLELPTPTSLDMPSEGRRRKTIELLAQWNLALSELQPLVLFVEDLHWCDASSLELIGRLVAQSATARLLLIATARPGAGTPWPVREHVTTLPLARLARREARAMIAALGGTALSEATLATLLARADGVPLYVEELTKSVVEPGGAQAIPATLADSLMARLDRLSAAKEVAQRAAVLGREFSYRLLAAVAELDEAALRDGLERLVQAEIVFQRGEPPEASYAFKHALVQEAAYESLLKRTRVHLHGRVVDRLPALFPERAAAEPEAMARHAEAAGRTGDAIVHYQRAGERAQGRSAHDEAIRHLRHAIRLLETQASGAERDAREVSLQLALAGSLVAVQGYAHPDTEAAYERARIACEALDDERQHDLVLIGLSTFAHNSGQPERARTLAARVLSAAAARNDRELILLGHLQIANAELFQGAFASSLAHHDAVLSLHGPGRHQAAASMLGHDARVLALVFSAWDLWILGWPSRALARAGEAIALARQLGELHNLAITLFGESLVHCWRRDLRALRARAAETVTVSEAHGFPLWAGLGKALHAWAGAAAGESGAIAELLGGLALAAQTGNAAGVPLFFSLLAEAYQAVGQLSDAQAAVEQGHAVAAATGQRSNDSELHRIEAEILVARGGAPADAERLMRRALEIARAQEAKSLELRAATGLARLLRRQDREAEARSVLAPIYGWFVEGLDTQDLLDAKALLEES